jgi:ribosomal protein S18 acetylase RimI-like enzyme
MPVDLRLLASSDQSVLWDMLDHAIYAPNGQKPPLRAILESPDIARYVADWGRQEDIGYLALEGVIPVGAVWLRLMHGYGYVKKDIPELSIAVLPSHRGRGIGTTLLKAIINSAEPIYPGISLSVSLENPAAHLYERFGFQVVRLDGDLKIMLLRFKNDKTKITQ